jgi:hypothetical protein
VRARDSVHVWATVVHHGAENFPSPWRAAVGAHELFALMGGPRDVATRGPVGQSVHSRISRLVATWGNCTEGYRCQPNNAQCRQCYSRFPEREGRTWGAVMAPAARKGRRPSGKVENA